MPTAHLPTVGPLMMNKFKNVKGKGGPSTVRSKLNTFEHV